MEFPESNKKECADILGIGKKELFNCFYLAIREKDLKKHVEKGKDLVRISKDSDCYDKILIVWGHPFIAYISVYGAVSIDEEYKFFRIKEKNIENFEVVKFLWPEFRGDRYSLSLKDEVRIDSSELDKRLLKKIFINSGYDKGTYPDGFVHWRSEDIIKEAALSFFTEKEMTIFYEDVKDAKDNNKLKILIMKKLHNQKFFTDIVVNDNESEIIKAEAVTKADITDINILLSIFKKAQ